MSLLGIDVGTTGCKAVVFSSDGTPISSGYAEYAIAHPRPHWAELDAAAVWELIQSTIRRAAEPVRRSDPIRALSVASMGEATVPVTEQRKILGPSILINDARGEEYIAELRRSLSDEECYRITGNPIGNQFGLSKLMWIRDNQPALYAEAFKFLNWSSFVAFMLGAEPAVDWSLANRNLLFDLEAQDWSDRLIAIARLDRAKLAECVPPGAPVGKVSSVAAGALGIPADASIACGVHDQCANALGCGVTEPGAALWGMGTFPTIAPVFEERKNPSLMVKFGLNTEHHAVPGRYLSFIYHMGGESVKWYRDTFAREEVRAARGDELYRKLFAELSPGPGRLLLLPHLRPMGPPDFISDSAGVLVGLQTSTRRAEVLKAIVESNAYALKVSVDNLSSLGISIHRFVAAGGGSRAEAAVQICADIMNRPIARQEAVESGALGAAILAGIGSGDYRSAREALSGMNRPTRLFTPNPERAARYAELYSSYRGLETLILEFTRAWMKKSPIES